MMKMNSFEEYMKIGFDRLEIVCIIGLLPHERVVEQKILLDLRVSIKSFSKNDELASTIDYRELATYAAELAQTRRYQLLETFVQELLEYVLTLPQAVAASARVSKESAFSNASAAVVEAQLTRKL